MPANQPLITACTMDCPDACSLLVGRHKTGGLRLRGNPDHPFTAGFTCKKIHDHISRLGSADRITRPLLRKGGSWQTLSWEAALDLCAEKIRQCRSAPHAILHIHGSGAKGVLKEANSLFFDLLGSTRVRGSLCDAAGIMAYHYDFGSRRNPQPHDLFNARRIVNWGKDLSRSSIHTGALVKKARKQAIRVLTISPGGDGNPPFSDDQIRIRPGTDRFLAAAALRRLLADNTLADRFEKHVAHWQAFAGLLNARNETDLLQACGARTEDLDRLYAYYTAQGPTATLVGAGLQRYRRGGENIRFINALALLSGHIGRSGGGSYFHLHSLGLLNMQWARGPGRGYRRSLQMAAIGRDILAARDPEIKMIWVNGVNVVNQALQAGENARAFEETEFKVVADAFFNDTASRADLILPAALMLEQEDLIGSFLHDYIHYVRAVADPPGQARPDLWMVRELGRRLDPPIEIPDADTLLRSSLQAPGIDITLEDLRRKGFYQVRQPDVPYAGLVFDHPDGKARLPLELHPDNAPPEEFPLRLLTLVRRSAIHSQIPAEKQTGPPMVWVSPDNPHIRHVAPEKPVFLVSPLGRLEVRLERIQDLHPDVVIYRRGDWMALGGGANRLIQACPTDLGGGSAYYEQQVRLENG